jgi:hypothetical protein
MTDEPRQKFGSLMRRAIGPIAAGAARKRQMAEELHAHLWEAYQEETSRLHDQEAAADAAIRRLGNADDFRRELQASVPWLERIVFFFGDKETLMSRWQLTVGLVMLLIGFGWMVGLALLMPALAQHRDDVTKSVVIGLFIYSLAVTSGGAVIAGCGLVKSRRSVQ